jgi:hypothetical protein
MIGEKIFSVLLWMGRKSLCHITIIAFINFSFSQHSSTPLLSMRNLQIRFNIINFIECTARRDNFISIQKKIILMLDKVTAQCTEGKESEKECSIGIIHIYRIDKNNLFRKELKM